MVETRQITALDALWDAIEAAGPRQRDPDFLVADWWLDETSRKESFRSTFSYAVPSRHAIAEIVRFANGPILEIGAGRGLWAHLIELHGGTIRVTDIHAEGGETLSSNPYNTLKGGPTWTGVERLSAHDAAREATEPTLLTIWPAYAEGWAAAALAAFRGSRLIYIGEGYGGCTADDAFHDLLDRDWSLHAEIDIPQWWGLHDGLFLFNRRGLPAHE